MSKKKEISPKHSLHVNHRNGGHGHRSAATVKRLNMYKTRAKRDKKGKIVKVDYGSKDLPCTRIQPDRRWFPPTRVIDPKQLEYFREELEKRKSNNYNVILNEKKLPMSLINNLPKKRAHFPDTQSSEDVIGPKSDTATIKSTDSQALLQKRDTARVSEKGENKHNTRSYLNKLIHSSDVVIQVLDARDPQGTRCSLLEEQLKENCMRKHMILLLNKCDLIPAWATKAWIKALSTEHPTLAYHANISKPFGKDSLLSILKQFAELKGDNQAISVGFVGYPGVGKASVLNTLRTKDVVSTTDGEVWQHISLTEKVYLIDCPGVVYPNNDSSDIILKVMVEAKNLLDAVKHLGDVFRLVKKEHLKRTYKIKNWEDENDFLIQLCNLTGIHLKDGQPDLMTAAKIVMDDWKNGKIPYYVAPPLKHDNDAVSLQSNTF